ncbi:MAG: EVE domain-containing protein [Alphaproteobacteria bacterium]|nr:EVE domain-containing protein [Alphaproteobacteria bacterium]
MAFVYEGCWIFCSNPGLWAIDKFLLSGPRDDSWGVPLHQARHFARGQRGFIRVGVDSRTKKQLEGRPRMRPGIYAHCEVRSAARPDTDKPDPYWYETPTDRVRPSVKLRYLRSFLDKPLLIDTLRLIAPDIDPLVLRGFRQASFPISRKTYRRLLELLD